MLPARNYNWKPGRKAPTSEGICILVPMFDLERIVHSSPPNGGRLRGFPDVFLFFRCRVMVPSPPLQLLFLFLYLFLRGEVAVVFNHLVVDMHSKLLGGSKDGRSTFISHPALRPCDVSAERIFFLIQGSKEAVYLIYKG